MKKNRKLDKNRKIRKIEKSNYRTEWIERELCDGDNLLLAIETRPKTR